MPHDEDRSRIARWLAIALVLSACFLPAFHARAEDVARKPFSDDEKKRLVAGQLVTRSTSERRGDLRLIGGASWQVINAPPDVVFKALLDTKGYDKLLPTVTRAYLVSEAAALRRVVLEHKKGPLGVSYRLALTIDAARRDITFKLNDKLDSGMRAAWGFFAATPYGSNKTLLSYGVMADPGDGLIVGLVRGNIHEWLLKVPQQTRWRIESREGRARYGSSLGAGAGRRGLSNVGQRLDGGQAQQRAP